MFFNDIDIFPIVENQMIDLMHDTFEGVANCTNNKSFELFNISEQNYNFARS